MRKISEQNPFRRLLTVNHISDTWKTSINDTFGYKKSGNTTECHQFLRETELELNLFTVEHTELFWDSLNYVFCIFVRLELKVLYGSIEEKWNTCSQHTTSWLLWCAVKCDFFQAFSRYFQLSFALFDVLNAYEPSFDGK